MKFLLAVSILATTSVFADINDNHRKIRCYESAEQGGRGDLAYVLEERGQGGQVLHVTYPFRQPLKWDGECLSHPGDGSEENNRPSRLSLCPAQGQTVRYLVPVEAKYDGEERTVYCERRILNWFENDLTLL